MAVDGVRFGEGVTVLLAEPPSDGWGLRAPLEALGHRVLGEAADGETAVRLAERLDPGLLVMDVHLDGLCGLGAAERIQARRRRPLVFVASRWCPASLDAAIAAGALACLVRPVRVVQLELSLQVALGLDALMAALRREQAELAAKLEAGKLAVRAKGILMRRLGVGEAEAHLLLQHRARRTRRPLTAVVEEVLAADRFFADLERGRPPAAPDHPRPLPPGGGRR